MIYLCISAMQWEYLMISFIEILKLSAIQGIFEFLPVSSSAHLILFSENQNLLIDLCLHLGSLLAILFFFRKDLINFDCWMYNTLKLKPGEQ